MTSTATSPTVTTGRRVAGGDDIWTGITVRSRPRTTSDVLPVLDAGGAGHQPDQQRPDGERQCSEQPQGVDPTQERHAHDEPSGDEQHADTLERGVSPDGGGGRSCQRVGVDRGRCHASSSHWTIMLGLMSIEAFVAPEPSVESVENCVIMSWSSWIRLWQCMT